MRNCLRWLSCSSNAPRKGSACPVGIHRLSTRAIQTRNLSTEAYRPLQVLQSNLKIPRRIATCCTYKGVNGISTDRAYSTYEAATHDQLVELKEDSEFSDGYHESNEICQQEEIKQTIKSHLHFLNDEHAVGYSDESSDRLNILHSVSRRYLDRNGFTISDVKNWEWIYSADCSDTMAERLSATNPRPPLFLLLGILQGTIYRISSLEKLLLCAKDIIVTKDTNTTIAPAKMPCDSGPVPKSASHTDDEILLLFKSLLLHARRLSPPTLVGVAELVQMYMHSVPGRAPDQSQSVDNSLQRSLCQIYNTTLTILGYPSSAEPYKSMTYNWRAQTILLQMGSTFTPPLIMDHNSYRSVAYVLAASKKTPRESTSAKLRMRSWPPWRIEQDGMDARRHPKEDVSRVKMALERMMESGYHLTVQDVALHILGGQELDGTPTIHTRWIESPGPEAQMLFDDELHPYIWAARIRATRDVEEGWSAFLSFTEAGGQPDHAVYTAMLEKLLFEEMRMNGRSLANTTAAPGDGLEQYEPSHDGFSEFYRNKLQPPSFKTLYDEMTSKGLQVSDRMLTIMVRTAEFLTDGLQYMHDAGMNPELLSTLEGSGENVRTELLAEMPDALFTAFLRLLCRFTPRYTNPEHAKYTFQEHARGSAYAVDSTLTATKNTAGTKDPTIKELRPGSEASYRFPNPLLLATRILVKREQHNRAAWYTVFRNIAGRGTVIDRRISRTRNDIMAWRVFEALLNDFHSLGLELDFMGFHTLCYGAEKAAQALNDDTAIHSEDPEFVNSVRNSFEVLKQEFRRLTRPKSTDSILPRLSHAIYGSYLHIYMRVLGALGDYEEMMFLLKWIVRNQALLDRNALSLEHGHSYLRLVMMSFRCFAGDQPCAEEGRSLIDSITAPWGGWPPNEEMAAYRNTGGRLIK